MPKDLFKISKTVSACKPSASVTLKRITVESDSWQPMKQVRTNNEAGTHPENLTTIDHKQTATIQYHITVASTNA